MAATDPEDGERLVLIAGGTGRLATRVVKLLIQKGHSVRNVS